MILRFFVAILFLALAGCSKSDAPASAAAAPGAERKLTIGVAFETLQTEYWVAGFEALKADLKQRDFTMLEASLTRTPTASSSR